MKLCCGDAPLGRVSFAVGKLLPRDPRYEVGAAQFVVAYMAIAWPSLSPSWEDGARCGDRLPHWATDNHQTRVSM